MPRFQDGSSTVDQMTRLKLRLLEKRLENEKQDMDDRAESAQSAMIYDGHLDALYSALRRQQDLLQRLREQQMLEDLHRPHTWGGSRRHHQSHFVTVPPRLPALPSILPTHIHDPAPALSFLAPPPPAVPPRIIPQTLPQHPATIIQQLPQQQPLIAKIPPPQLYPALRSGSVKEDMVELMLMQNAQMHQIIMHNMMLKAMPPMALSPTREPDICATHVGQMSGQEEVLSIIIITTVLTLQQHSCLLSVTLHGYHQASHQDKQGVTSPPYTMQQHLFHSHQSMRKMHMH
ncbi:unnamed protein product [Pleuronectes platessa]|uniref:DUF4587 domain-containing protein n=1 Tax=Pleuronectes platessa TaxID=8262 RepID=A0A9N7TZ15_PLEPL|nr:unnamed protein product [Pleuronectes platessa]